MRRCLATSRLDCIIITVNFPKILLGWGKFSFFLTQEKRCFCSALSSSDFYLNITNKLFHQHSRSSHFWTLKCVADISSNKTIQLIAISGYNIWKSHRSGFNPTAIEPWEWEAKPVNMYSFVVSLYLSTNNGIVSRLFLHTNLKAL